MTFPVVSVHDIADEGLSIEGPVDHAWLRAALEGSGVEPAETGENKLTVRLDKSGRDVIVSGYGAVTIKGECVVCLTEVVLPLPLEFTLHLEPADGPRHTSAQKEVELTSGELDTDVYHGDKVDVGEWVREAIVLEVPAHPRHDDSVACKPPYSATVEAARQDPRLGRLKDFVTKKE